MHKVAIVVQRYGEEVVGGAELHAKQIAEKMVSDLGWNVEVLTTTSQDYRTWKNQYPQGVTEINGVKVRRFHSLCQRWPFFNVLHDLFQRFLPSVARRSYLRWLVPALEKIWLLAQGPVCPRLIRFLKKNQEDYQRVYFFTYLYYPSLWGYRCVREKAVLIPEAHDEFAFHFGTVKKMINEVPYIIVNTPAELDLVKTKLEREDTSLQVAGIGIDTSFYHPKNKKPASGGFTYLGRISHGKGVSKLIDWCARTLPDVTLHLAGKVEQDFEIPKTQQIIYHGFVSDEEKASLIRNSLCVVNPSAFESLSILVLEALASKTPVFVNTTCPVLEYYTKVCPTAFGFRTEAEFVAGARQIQNINWQSSEWDAKLEQSRRWVEEQFSWSGVMRKFGNVF